jgi:hypothetical protein
MYCDDMDIGSWAAFRGRCTARYVITDGNSVEFSFHDREKTLDLAFDADALEAFVRLGSVALEEMRRFPAPD